MDRFYPKLNILTGNRVLFIHRSLGCEPVFFSYLILKMRYDKYFIYYYQFVTLMKNLQRLLWHMDCKEKITKPKIVLTVLLFDMIRSRVRPN